MTLFFYFPVFMCWQKYIDVTWVHDGQSKAGTIIQTVLSPDEEGFFGGNVARCCFVLKHCHWVAHSLKVLKPFLLRPPSWCVDVGGGGDVFLFGDHTRSLFLNMRCREMNILPRHLTCFFSCLFCF